MSVGVVNLMPKAFVLTGSRMPIWPGTMALSMIGQSFTRVKERWTVSPSLSILAHAKVSAWKLSRGKAKNTKFAVDFLMKWAAWEWMQPSNFNGADNGVLHAHLMKTLISEAREEFENCNAIWHKATDYDSYMAFFLCIRIYLGAKRLWPDQVRIYKRAHGWVRDRFITSDKWSERDFMIHGNTGAIALRCEFGRLELSGREASVGRSNQTALGSIRESHRQRFSPQIQDYSFPTVTRCWPLLPELR
ncbi:hypothetical protein WR25_18734 [Diploscapter pachys]|uniref:Uncharacterized protein n=1 Tax=Diploscapter pachys TaxID=2018661 RepID=A0A2A2K425_9BILA|nr:hypothetical protein WR25_18734 [Diploscapter pachys]